MAIGRWDGINKDGVLGSGLLVANVQLMGLGIMNSGDNVIGPSAHSQLKSLLLGQTASAKTDGDDSQRQ